MASERYNAIKRKLATQNIPAPTQEKEANSSATGGSERLEKIKEKIRSGGFQTSMTVDDVDDFYRDSRSFVKQTANAYSELTWEQATSEEYKTRLRETGEDLSAKASQVRTYLNANKATIDPEAYQEYIQYLDDFSRFRTQSATSFDEAYSLYGKYESQEAYDQAVKEGIQQAEWQQKYAGMNLHELQYAADKLEDGQEKEWLTDYATSKMTRLDYTKAIQAKKGEIGAMIALQDEYNHLTKRLQVLATSSEEAQKATARQAEIYQQYGDLDDYIEKLEKEKWELEMGEKYGFLRDNRDYESKSVKHVDYINDSDEALLLNYMEKDELADYYYLLNTSGYAAAQEYYDYIESTLKAKHNAELVAEAAEFASNHRALASVFSIAYSLGSGAEYLVDIMDYGIEKAFGNKNAELDYNQSALLSSTIRRTVSEQTDWMIGNWDAFDFVYNTTMSGVDSVAAATLFGGFGGIALGLSAAAQGTNDALNRGMSDGQAFWSGLFSGAFECVFESISIGQFNSLKEVAPESVKDILKNLAKSMLVNASEETLTEIANIGYDTLVNGEFANYTLEELKNGAWKNALWQVLESGGSGLLIGSGMSTVASTSAYVNQQAQNYKSGKTIKKSGGTDALMDLAYEVANRSTGDMQETLNKQIGKVNKKATSARVGKLYNTVNAANNRANASANQADIAKSLMRNNFSEQKANAIAEALVSRYNGQELTKEQNKLLRSVKNNEAVQNAISNIMDNTKSTMGQRSQNIRDFQRDVDIGRIARKTGISTETVKAILNDDLTDTVEKATESSYEVSADGKATQISTGQAISVQRIASIKNGEMTFWTKDGSKVDAKDISFDSEHEADVYAAVAKLSNNAKVANLLVDAYHMEPMDGIDFAQGIREAYQYGKLNISQNEMQKYGSYAMNLSNHQRELAYDLGQLFSGKQISREAAAIRRSKKSGRRAEGKVHFDGDRSKLNDTQQAGLDAMELLAKALGVQFYVFESEVDADGERIGKDGWYDHRDGSIYIDLYAGADGKGTMLFTVAHELTHYIRQWSPVKFKILANYLMEQYGKQGVSVNELIDNQIAKAKRDNRTIDREEAFEEVVADSMETMLNSGKVLQGLADIRKQDRTLAEKIQNWFKDLAEKLKGIVSTYKNVSPDSVEGRLVADMKDVISTFEALYGDALLDAAENFSLDAPIEQTADLLAYHNITVQQLMDALDRNSLLMPSLAITNKGMTDFGEISLLFDKRTIDPAANRENRLYGSDAWTPQQNMLKKNAKFDVDKTVGTVNTIKNRIGSKFAPALFDVTAKQFRDAIIQADGNIFDVYSHHIGMQTAYAIEQGIISKIPTNQNGALDTVALKEQLDKELDTDEGWRQYRKWLRNISDTIITSYDTATNEDIISNMRKQPATAKAFKLSENGELVVPAVEYSSIEEMRKNKNRLSENAQEATKAVAAEFMAFAKRIDGNMSTVVSIINAAFATRYSTSGIVDIFNSKGIKISNKTASELQALYKKAVELPTQYFEGKPHREVGMNEIKAVVLPAGSDLTALKNRLDDLGIPVVEYQADSKKARIDALNSVENLKFSGRNRRQAQKNTAESGEYGSRYSIREGMTDSERYTVLKDETIVVHGDGKSANYSVEIESLTQLSDRAKSKAEKIIIPLAKRLGILGKTLTAKDVDVDFIFSKNKGLPESISKQLRYGGNYVDFAKTLINLDKVIESAVLIEVHGDKYKGTVRENENLEAVYVLFSAFRDGTNIIPVQMEIKKSSDVGGRLYLSVALTKIEANVLGSTLDESQTHSLMSASKYSLADLFSKINPSDKHFLKYLPDGFLNEEQRIAKTAAIREDNARIASYVRRSARDPAQQKIQKALKEENARLQADVSRLEELVKLQRTGTGGAKFTKTSVEAAARMLKKYANAKRMANTGELAQLLHTFYEYVATEKELSWEKVREQAQHAVRWLQDNVDLKEERSEYAQTILNQMKDSRIYLDESQRTEAAYRFGSYNDFRKALFGKVTLVNDGNTSLDSWWHSMADQFPDVFHPATSSTDMPGALFDIVEQLRNADNSRVEYEYNRASIAMDLTRQVYDSYWRVSTLYTVADRAQQKIDRLKSHHYQQMNKLRADQNTRIEQIKEDNRADRQRIAESRQRTEVRRKILRVTDELNRLLLREDKKQHVPDSLKKAVASAMALLEIDPVNAVERITRLDTLISQATDPDIIDSLMASRDRIREQAGNIGARLRELHTAYAEIMDSSDPDIAAGYDPVIDGNLRELAKTIGNTPFSKLSLEQLEDVYSMYKMVLTRVRDANKAFMEDRNANISDLASRVAKEIRRAGGEHTHRAAILDPVRKFDWNNLKPVYAFERLGSATLSEAFKNVRKGEDMWIRDVSEAKSFYRKKSKQYGYDSWDFKRTYHFESVSGLGFDLTLEQIMSLYAYSKRKQAHEHLRLGGFVFDSNIETYKEKDGKKSILKYKVNTADAHQLTPEILSGIIDSLSAEQRAFVDEMQDYLSSNMGAKGNEVSMKMYGVKLFKEKFYFPLKSAKQFLFEQNEVAGEVRIKSSGFTNKAVPKANNPIILNNFMDVWAGHVNDMSMYHSFVLPLEDFNRIFNYNSPKKEGQPSVSVKGTIQSAYTPAAVDYVKELITDLNGGAVSDPRETFAKTMTSKFKKAKVMASLSVIIQQPSAIARAFALINPVYFHPTKDGMNHSQLWEEVKRYAPVAVIKEMGYFDTGMGRSTIDFIKGKEYSSIKEKAKAIVTDSNYRDELLAKGPALADEVTWCAIWNAVKRETKAKHKDLAIGSEAFLKAAGDRFTEVVTKTQVYDSVLARSAHMRSKSGLMNMATSFMAEPTTAINMLEDALRKAKRGYKGYAARAVASVAVSIILNNALVAIVYAGRDDDEDETYAEKYMQSFVSNMLDDINPITYYPFLKDMWSLLQGFDVERADMSLIGDIADAMKRLTKAYVSADGDVSGAWWDVADSVVNLAGFPLQNIRRDVVGAINFKDTVIEDIRNRDTTWGSMGDALESAVRDSLPVIGWLSGETKADKLYGAMINGDTVYKERLKNSYVDKDGNFNKTAYRSAVRKGLRNNDPRIKKAAQARLKGDHTTANNLLNQIAKEGIFARVDIAAAIKAEYDHLKDD